MRILLGAIAIVSLAAPARAGAPCVPKYGQADGALQPDGKTFIYCAGDEPRTCWSVDLTRGTWDAGPYGLPAQPEPLGEAAPDPGAHAPGDLVIGPREVAICDDSARKKCKRWPLTVGFATETTFRRGDYELDATAGLLAIGTLIGDEDHAIEIAKIDLKAGKLTGEVHQRYEGSVAGVHLMDGSILLDTIECAGPCQQTWIYSDDGHSLKKVSVVGGNKDPYETSDWSPIRVGPHRFAFQDSIGIEVVFQDVRTGKISKRVQVRPSGSGGADRPLHMLQRPDGTLLFWGGGGALSTLDPTATKPKAKMMTGPICPDDP